MSMTTTTPRFVRTLEKTMGLLVVALGAGLGLAACEEKNGTGNLRIGLSCSNDCERAKACSDEVDVDECEANCESAASDCMADEQEEALDDLDDCAAESCDDFAVCTAGAGLACAFGR